jgi:hypothetical protein
LNRSTPVSVHALLGEASPRADPLPGASGSAATAMAVAPGVCPNDPWACGAPAATRAGTGHACPAAFGPAPASSAGPASPGRAATKTSYVQHADRLVRWLANEINISRRSRGSDRRTLAPEPSARARLGPGTAPSAPLERGRDGRHGCPQALPVRPGPPDASTQRRIAVRAHHIYPPRLQFVPAARQESCGTQAAARPHSARTSLPAGSPLEPSDRDVADSGYEPWAPGM